MFTFTPRLKNYIYDLTQNGREITTRGEKYLTLSPDSLIPVSMKTSNASNSFMFKTDQGWMFFKSADEDEIVSEILSSYIANNLGMNVVDPIPVEIGDMYGVVMPSYLPENFNGKKFSFNDLHIRFSKKHKNYASQYQPTCFYIMTILENLSDLGESFSDIKIDPEIRYSLTKMAVFDFLTRQCDRHGENIEFLVQDGVMSLAPMFDNASSFFFDHWASRAYFGEWTRQFVKTELIKNSPLFGTSNDLRFKFTLPKEKIFELMGFENKENYTKEKKSNNSTADQLAESAKTNLDDLARILHCNPTMKEFCNRIKYINMQRIFDEIEHDMKIKLSYKHRYVSENLFNHQRNILISATEEKARESNQRKKLCTSEQSSDDESLNS